MSLTFGFSADTNERKLKGLVLNTTHHFLNWSFYAQLYLFRKLLQKDFSTADIVASNAKSEEQPCLAGLIRRWSEQAESGALDRFKQIYDEAKESLRASLTAKYTEQPSALQQSLANGMAELGIEGIRKEVICSFVPRAQTFRHF